MDLEVKQYIQDEVSKTLAILELLAGDQHITAEVERIAQACCAALRAGHKILFAGNGGSAADAQHLAGELVSRFNFDRPGLAAFALTTDTSVLTAIGNDYGYDKVFARQLNAVGASGDVSFALSTSRRSPNILRALEKARGRCMVTVGLTGEMGRRHVAPLRLLDSHSGFRDGQNPGRAYRDRARYLRSHRAGVVWP